MKNKAKVIVSAFICALLVGFCESWADTNGQANANPSGPAKQVAKNNLSSERLPVPAPTLRSHLDNGESSEALTALSRSLGVSKSQWQIIIQDKPLLERLRTLSDPAKELYKSLSFFDKLKFQQQVHGKTETMLFTVDNLPAFVTGKAAGCDTFVFLQDSLEQKSKEGKITQEEYQRRLAGLQGLSKLSPDERSTLVTLVDAELSARHPEKEEIPLIQVSQH